MTDVAAPDLERTLDQHRAELTGYCYRPSARALERRPETQW
jgi:hypothetical protein